MRKNATLQKTSKSSSHQNLKFKIRFKIVVIQKTFFFLNKINRFESWFFFFEPGSFVTCELLQGSWSMSPKRRNRPSKVQKLLAKLEVSIWRYTFCSQNFDFRIKNQRNFVQNHENRSNFDRVFKILSKFYL